MSVLPLFRLLLPLYLLLACGDASTSDLTERAAAVEAHDSLLDALPDAAAIQLSPLDSLFIAYPNALFLPAQISAEEAARWADSVYASLTLDQRIGQLFIVALPRTTLLNRLTAETQAFVRQHQVGGFLISRLMSPEDAFQTITRLQQQSHVPLFIAADYERGAGRFSNALTEIPSNMAIGATRNPALAAASGRLTALESRAIGVNFVFAPVADVNNNADNPIINIRSYGERGGLVGEMAGAFVEQAQRYGVLTTMKHFPGHGNTAVDTHSRLATVPGNRAALDSVELRPFEMVLSGNTPPAAVMTAHVWAAGLDATRRPSTFSPPVLTALLRDTLGYDGLVVTDDVRMGALQNTYSLAQRVTMPLLAGADVILTPRDLPAAMGAVQSALRDGTLTPARFETAVKRVLRAKAQADLHRRAEPDRIAYDFLMARPYGAPIAQRIADDAVTLLKTSPALPVTGKKTLLLHLSNYRDSESISAAMDFMETQLAGTDSSVHAYRYDRRPPASAQAALQRAARQADVIVVALYLRLVSGRGSAGLVEGQRELVEALLASGKPVVLVTFGNPYAALSFSDPAALLVLYDQTLASVQAAAGVLRGTQAPRGRLPITVGSHPFGAGLTAINAP